MPASLDNHASSLLTSSAQDMPISTAEWDLLKRKALEEFADRKAPSIAFTRFSQHDNSNISIKEKVLLHVVF
ncbi:hypothetical protein [Bombella saccharophila]|uniref:Uncharacterized protein n=1 Tax=Bombella saccharophila TaxID=2967338 RepID=A0ABT3WC15_9PROT|nr:hypothetical protein [Bombella saccharophila]MCX5615317.1 hypothetical protein [Bombella saccharophila]PHI95480.1 hypothetical protein BG621_06930 [Parasaccharibacter apium]